MSVAFSKLNYILAAAILAAIAVLGSTTAGEPTTPERHIALDGPVYPSVESLAAESDAIIVGSITQLLSRQVDYGGQLNKDRGSGLPLALYEVTVEEVLTGISSDVESVVVSFVDSTVVAGEAIVEVGPGDRGVFYLKAESQVSAPGVDAGALEFYSPMNMNNGYLRIENDTIVATGSFPLALDESTASKVAEARAAAEESSGRQARVQPMRVSLQDAIEVSRR